MAVELGTLLIAISLFLVGLTGTASIISLIMKFVLTRKEKGPIISKSLMIMFRILVTIVLVAIIVYSYTPGREGLFYFLFGAILYFNGLWVLIKLLLDTKDPMKYCRRSELVSKITSIFLFITLTASLLLLYIYFITSNMNIEYVWEYSSTQAPLEYKIAGVLAGMKGSLLFWIWCMGLSLFIEEIVDLKKPKNKVLMNLTRTIMMMIIAIFLYFLITRDLFAGTPKENLIFRPEGFGLNPLLQTPLMIAHPPIVFLAYGFIVIAMASSMAYLICNEKDWVKLSMPWSRWAWLFLTLGIGIGGLWAYVVLGWGGYWAWDPVETSSFLPWIILTAFLHAQLMFKRKGDYKLAAPALGIYTFVLVIFATFTTRAGGIWISVHAFGQADVQVGAYDRFINTLNADVVIMGYFILMVGVAILGAILLIWALVRWGDEEHSQTTEREFLEEFINDRSLMFITLIVFTISTIVTLLLLIMAVNGLDRNLFDIRVGAFAIVGVIVLIACLIWKYIGIKATAHSRLLTMGISLILLLLYPDYGIVAFTTPILVLALGVSIYKIVKSINKKSLRGSINGIAPHLVHLGVVLIILGFVGSNFLTTEEDITLDLNGSSQKVGNYDLKLVDGEYVQYDSIFAKIEISQNGNVIGTAEPGGVYIYKYLFSLDSEYEQYLSQGFLDFNIHIAFQENNLFLSSSAFIYPVDTDKWIIEDFISENNLRLYQIINTGSDIEIYTDPQWRNEVRVHSTPFEDIYLIFNDDPISSSTFTQVEFQVKLLPLMSILWIGMWLMAIGIFMRLIVVFKRPKGKPESRVSRRARMRDKEESEEEGAEEEEEKDEEEIEGEDEEGEEEEKDTDYYEDLIEKELEEMD
jgi:cytochrome c-type biogenesis protein CcmF